MINVAIIGSNGFIGRHLTQRLLKETDTSLFLFGRSEEGYSEAGTSYKKIDFFDNESLSLDFKHIDLVYYLVSETIPATSWLDPNIEIQKNLNPFINFLEVISKLKVKKIAFVSSAGTVYGATSGKVQEDSDKKPFSPYGIIKLAMENFLNYYKAKYNMEYDIYRVSNVYGEGQNTGKGLGLINTFLEKILLENKVEIFGDGASTRNYIYVKDVAELLTHSLRSLQSSDIYNISSNSTLSINEVVAIMKKKVDENFDVIYKESRQSDNSYIDLINTKILTNFNKFNFTAIDEGIEKTYHSLKAIHTKS